MGCQNLEVNLNPDDADANLVARLAENVAVPILRIAGIGSVAGG